VNSSIKKSHPLILICAPAIMEDNLVVVVENIWQVENNDRLHLRVASLDESDGDVMLFLEYLIATLQTIFEGA
jgi:hypothetical protein